MALTIAVLESLFTANVQDFEKKADQVDKTQKALDKSDPTVKVGAETKGALADMVKVETSAKKITDTKIVSQVDADISKAQASATKIKTSLDVLKSLPVDVTVTADIAKATAALDKTETRLAALSGARAEMVVVADVGKAERALDGVAAKAGEAGAKGGKDAGEGMSAGILAAIIALPVAGAIVGVGAAIGKSLMDGIQVEVRSDALMAKTGLDAKSVAPIARAAGEAYANNFGPSIAENMDTARIAIQGGLLDVDGTEKDSQAVIESLAGVADIIGEDIARVSRSTAQLLRTGLAKDAAGAFDLIVKGTQAGLNVSEDLLDTIDEYSTQFRQLGLDGPQAFGLLSQAVKGGARDTDTAADALKEFAIRSVDMSKTSVAAFDFLGISSTKMADTMTSGGPKAAAALDQVLDKIRSIKDPADQMAIAVALFGTKAEDMGTALFKMDLSTAVTQLGNVEGAAKSAIATLGDNTAGALASAQRNIEVAADGIKGALATAFAPQIQGFATFVTENREAVMQFLLDMANGAIDAGRALANAAASGTEGFGGMVGAVVPMILNITESVLKVGQAIAFAMDPTGVRGIRGAADEAIDSFRKWKPTAEAGAAAIKTGSETAAQAIRTNIITNGLDPAQARLNGIAIPLIVQARMHDMSLKLAAEIDAIKQGKVPGIDANTKAGKAKIAALQAEIDRLQGKTVTITTNIHENYTQTGAHNTGSRAAKADGGHVTAASGLDRQSMIAPGGANILWAEPETGWETYISGKPSQRARNIGLLAETARRFGLAVLPRADGGSTSPAMATAGVGTMTVTVPVSVDGRELFKAVRTVSIQEAKSSMTGTSGLK